MDQPLGLAAGNGLETVECIEALRGAGPKDMVDLSVELGAYMLLLTDTAPSLEAARKRLRDVLGSGAGLEKFREVIELQGGDPRVCDDVTRLPQAREKVELEAEKAGFVSRIACRAVGHACMVLGGGRETVDSRIDPAVGVVLRKKVGDAVAAGEPLATIHANDAKRLADATQLLRAAFEIGPARPAPRPLIHAVLD
jgi:thymidine phosphorylase